jgi:hypothetical protein
MILTNYKSNMNVQITFNASEKPCNRDCYCIDCANEEIIFIKESVDALITKMLAKNPNENDLIKYISNCNRNCCCNKQSYSFICCFWCLVKIEFINYNL